MQFNIVYLDDEIDLCQIFEDIFTTDEVKIKAFIEPADAVSEIAINPPDLIFLDYRLQNTTGDIVAKQLGDTIPMALISGDLHIKPIESFSRIFFKPYDSVEIAVFIRQYVVQKKRLATPDNSECAG